MANQNTGFTRTDLNISEQRMLDIRSPEFPVQIEYDSRRKVLYVHIDGMTFLRVQNCTAQYALNSDDITEHPDV